MIRSDEFCRHMARKPKAEEINVYTKRTHQQESRVPMRRRTAEANPGEQDRDLDAADAVAGPMSASKGTGTHGGETENEKVHEKDVGAAVRGQHKGGAEIKIESEGGRVDDVIAKKNNNATTTGKRTHRHSVPV